MEEFDVIIKIELHYIIRWLKIMKGARIQIHQTIAKEKIIN
jgi:hypothetical protein